MRKRVEAGLRGLRRIGIAAGFGIAFASVASAGTFDRSIWVSETKALLRVSPIDGSAPLSIADARGLRAIAIAAHDGRGYVAGIGPSTGFVEYDFDGDLVFSTSLPCGDPEEGRHHEEDDCDDADSPHAAIANSNGVWYLGVGRTRFRYDEAGTFLGVDGFEHKAVAASFDPVQGRLWYGTTAAVYVGTAATIALSHEKLVSLDVDHSSGEAWVLTNEHLIHYDADGVLLTTRTFKHGVAVASDEAGGAWVAGGHLLERVDASGTFEEILLPRGKEEGGRIVALAADPFDGSAWVATERAVLRYAPDGSPDPDGVSLHDVRYFALAAYADITAPTLVIATPGEGEVVLPDVSLSLAYSDAESGVDPSTLSVAGDAGDPSYQCTTSTASAVCGPASPLSEGTHSVVASVRDFAGNLALANRSFVVKTPTPPATPTPSPSPSPSPSATPTATPIPTPSPGIFRFQAPPTRNPLAQVVVYYPTDGSVISSTFTLTANAGDPPFSCAIYSNGAVCTPTAAFPDGHHLLLASMALAAGGTTTGTWDWIIDSTPPVITVDEPADNSFVNQSVVLMRGHLDEHATLVIYSATTAIDASFAFQFQLHLASGLNTIPIRATDDLGNISNATLHVTFDNVAPAAPDGAKIFLSDGSSGATAITAVAGACEPFAAVSITNLATGSTVELTAGSDGSFSTTLIALPEDEISFKQTDRAGNAGPATVLTVPGSFLVPEPIAPPLDPTVVTNFATATRYLYDGPTRVQVGLDLAALALSTVAIAHGRVLDRTGAPIPDVRIAVLNHPELGSTRTRTDGQYDLAVNGGGVLVLDYSKPGWLEVQRQLRAVANDYALMDDVVMIVPDGTSTRVLMGATIGQLARASVATDGDGSRQSTLFIPAGTLSDLVFADGSTQPAPELTIRQTEFTVGSSGRLAMPAELPPTTAYTYAVDYSADEAVAVGADHVHFSSPVFSYLENFLGLPVGTGVPAASFDRVTARWIPSQDGVILQILSLTNGLADVDLDGAGTPADPATLAAFGFTDDERAQIGATYPVGATLWRVPVRDLIDPDLNLKWFPGPGSYPVAPNGGSPFLAFGPPPPHHDCPGSVVRCEEQTLGERFPIAGTPFQLDYWSDREPGRRDNYRIDVPLTGPQVPAGLLHVEWRVRVSGRQFRGTAGAAPNEVVSVDWDGRDSEGRQTQGAQLATVSVGFAFPAVFEASRPDATIASFGIPGGSVTNVEVRGGEYIIWATWHLPVGTFSYPALQLGGLALSAQHVYSPAAHVVFRGDGDTIGIDAPRTVNVVAGRSSTYVFGSENVPVIDTPLSNPGGLTSAPDGGYDFFEAGRVRHVDARGLVTTIANVSGSSGNTGDGGPARNAAVAPRSLARAPDGTLYVCDGVHNVVRKIAPDGIITTAAGTGTAGYSGDGGPATAARLSNPQGIAVGPDGTLFIADAGNFRIRRVSPNGTIMTAAGDGTLAQTGDGGPASGAQVGILAGMATSEDGSLYFVDYRLDGGVRGRPSLIRRIDANGILTTIAGGAMDRCESCAATSSLVESADSLVVASDRSVYYTELIDTSDPQPGARVRQIRPDGTIVTVLESLAATSGGIAAEGGEAALNATLNTPAGIAIRPDGSLLVGDSFRSTIRSLAPALPGYTGAGTVVASRDGSEAFVFDLEGRHRETRDALTGAPLLSFGYDTAGLLISITDRAGNATQIHRYGGEVSIVAPGGETTTVGLDANGLASSIRDPGGNITYLTMSSGGLLTDLIDPRGKHHTFRFDALGRLLKDADPVGGFTQLDRVGSDSSFVVTKTSALGRSMIMSVDRSDSENDLRETTAPDGTITTTNFRSQEIVTSTLPDGTQISRQLGADPRFGTNAPTSDTTVTTPAGKVLHVAETRDAALAVVGSPLSAISVTSTVTVNDKPYTSTYDAASQTITTTTPAGRQRVLTLDALGRVSSAQTGTLLPVSVEYDSHGRVAGVSQGTRRYTFAYDPTKIDQLTGITDPLLRSVGFHYDGTGRVDQQTLPDGQQVLAGYDASSNLTSLTPPGRPAHGFGYTDVDLQQSYAPPAVAGDGTRSTSYTYNADRQLTQVARPDARVITPTWDSASGRLTQLSWSSGTESFAYDAAGRLAALDAPGGVNLAFGYDGPLPLTETWSGSAGVHGELTRTFDDDFRLSSEALAGGASIAFSYDDDGLLAGAGAETIARSAETGQTTGTTLGNLTTSRIYNAYGEPARDAASYSGSPVYDAIYDDGAVNPRDALGRVQHLTQTIAGQTRAYDYRYDLRGRLAGVQVDGAITREYTFDGNGNRLTKTAGGVTTYYVYDDQDRLLCERSTTGTDCAADVTVGYAWTANGELAARMDAGGTTSYGYDELGNLRTVRLPDGTAIEYLIDGANRRVGKRVNGVITRQWLYRNSLKPVAELNGAGGIVAQFVYGSKGQVPDYILKGGATYRVISDHLGSPRLIVDVASGAVAERIDFDEWGNVTNDTNPGWQPFGFDGGLFDHDTGLVRFGARDYDARMGRWTAKDPIRFGAHVLSLYSFAAADPVNAIDPVGLIGFGLGVSEQTDVGVVAAGAGQTGMLGAGVFLDSGSVTNQTWTPGSWDLDAGAFASWGGFAGGKTPWGDWGPSYPSGRQCPPDQGWALGAFAGLGADAWVTNANNLGELGGPFRTYSVNAAFGMKGISVQFSVGADGTWILSYGGPVPAVPVTGVGIGVDVSAYNTNTWTSH